MNKIKYYIDFINKLPNTIVFILFTIVLTIVYSLLYNQQLFKNQYPEEYFLILMLMSFVRDAVIWYIAALNKWVFLIFAPIMFLFGSGLNYFVTTANMGIGIGMFELLFNTNINEAAGVIHTDFIVTLIISLIISAVFIVIRFFMNGIKRWKIKGLLLLVFLMPVFLGKLPEDDLKEVKYGKGGATERGIHLMPEKILENFYHYSLNQYRINKMLKNRSKLATIQVDYDELNEANPEIIVFILTDALRRDHMQINGYERETTPYLIENGFISYNDMYACETSTTRSVPCLTSRQSRKDDRMQFLKEPSILSIFKSAGFDTAWISAQNSISTSDYGANIIASDADFTFFNDNSIKYDYELLPVLDDFLSRNDKKKVVILHLNGSHWDYHIRYPEDKKIWTPECTTWVYDCGIEEVVNAYDNTIVATDSLFNDVVKRLKDKNAMIFFSSDHGQFLGEKGMRLHQHEMLHHKEVAVVPFGVWLSEKAKENNKYHYMINNKDKYTSHDNIFHSIAHCGGLSSSLIDENLSICSDKLISLPNEFP